MPSVSWRVLKGLLRDVIFVVARMQTVRRAYYFATPQRQNHVLTWRTLELLNWLQHCSAQIVLSGGNQRGGDTSDLMYRAV